MRSGMVQSTTPSAGSNPLRYAPRVGAGTSETLRLGELLAALSLATDLANGMPLEKGMRTCLLAVSVGRRMGLDDESLSDVFYVNLLRAIGCTAFASEEATAYGDDIAYRNTYFPVDFGQEAEIVEATKTNLARDEPPAVREAAVANFFAEGPRIAADMARAACSVAIRFASRIGLSDQVAEALTQLWERWDGKGFPRQISEDEISLPARLTHLATVAEIDHRVGGRNLARANVQQRRGGWFDPEVADAFLDAADEILPFLEQGSVWDAVLVAEGSTPRRIAADRLDDVTHAFADMIDLKSPYTLGHSSEVARLAQTAGLQLGLEADSLRHAGLLHDLGSISVSSGIWDKPSVLTVSEWERVRLHPYYSERILSQTPLLAHLAPIVGRHHERLDGTGYHRGARAPELTLAARVLAASDVYQALTEPRPHREALPKGAAARSVMEEAARGHLCPEAAAAVCSIAGHRPPKGAWPAGLTAREVDVARCLARGLTRAEIAAKLFISASTVHTHTIHVYEKTGVKTRAALALFAMENGLLYSDS
jgi:HD-GYP domain-containing protein (c-di-GMP phosphodiesterase class II)/DNA-binding CsgD family transcriptional regulator